MEHCVPTRREYALFLRAQLENTTSSFSGVIAFSPSSLYNPAVSRCSWITQTGWWVGSIEASLRTSLDRCRYRTGTTKEPNRFNSNHSMEPHQGDLQPNVNSSAPRYHNTLSHCPRANQYNCLYHRRENAPLPYSEPLLIFRPNSASGKPTKKRRLANVGLGEGAPAYSVRSELAPRLFDHPEASPLFLALSRVVLLLPDPTPSRSVLYRPCLQTAQHEDDNINKR